MDQVSLNSEPNGSGEDKTGEYKISHAVCTDVGLKRSENQDAFGFAHTKHAQLFIVADGMGGSLGGEVASSLTTHIVARAGFDSQGLINENSLKYGIEAANKVVHGLGTTYPQYKQMGTTIVALGLCQNKVYFAHVGDSRIYFIRDGKLQRLTKDHTLIQQLIDTNRITPEQAVKHPISHVLLSSIGGNENTEVSVGCLPFSLKPGDKFVLCCDGLTNEVSDSEIAEVSSALEPKQAVKCLASLANHRGGSDNVTVELIQVENEPSSQNPNQSLSDGQIALALSSDLDQKVQELVNSQICKFEEVADQSLQKNIVDLTNESTDKLFREASLSSLLEVKQEPLTKKTTESSDPDLDNFDSSLEDLSSNGTNGDSNRQGLPFDTMIFEGDSVEDILEVRRLYFAAKAMGTEKLSQVIADAENLSKTDPNSTSKSATVSRAAFNTALFVCGGLAFLLLGSKLPGLFMPDSNTSKDKAIETAARVEKTAPKLSDTPTTLKQEELKTETKENSLLTEKSVAQVTPIVLPIKEKMVEAKVIEETRPTLKTTTSPKEKAVQQVTVKQEIKKNTLKDKTAPIKQITKVEKKDLLPAKKIVLPNKKSVEAKAAVVQTLPAKKISLKSQPRKNQALLRKLNAELSSVNGKIDKTKDRIASQQATSTPVAKPNSQKLKELGDNMSSNKQALAQWRSWKAASINGGQLRSISEQIAPSSPEVRSSLQSLLSIAREHDELKKQLKTNPSFVLKEKRKALASSINRKGSELSSKVKTVIDRQINNLSGQIQKNEKEMSTLNRRSISKPKKPAANPNQLRELKRLESQKRELLKRIGRAKAGN